VAWHDRGWTSKSPQLQDELEEELAQVMLWAGGLSSFCSVDPRQLQKRYSALLGIQRQLVSVALAIFLCSVHWLYVVDSLP
jgi:hypothetical protein